jgi:cytochrome c-type biogenesis protein CcmF
MCLISKPFLKLPTVPSDGIGLPQALQDPWMTVHPPLVFIAYSAMGVLASFGIAADKSSLAAEKVQKWMRISWVFLGLGIFTGSIWAYRALGWGGYWAWDPIENAALIPWLMLCGFLHRKDRVNRACCVLPFAAACFGTFLTRSGILKDQSTHAYTEGNLIVTFVIGALLLTALCWLIIYWLRNRKEKEAAFKSGLQVRRKGGELPFAGVLHIYAILITLGTIAPMIVGTNTPIEYYAYISIAFVLSYSILLLLRDKEALKRRNLLMMAISTAIVICVALATGSTKIVWIILMWVCLMPLSLWLADRFRTNNWTFYLRHIGMILLIAGAITSSGLSRESIAFAKTDSASINIEGSNLWMTDLTNNDILIVPTLTGEFIIQCGNSVEANGYIAVSFITKPFIMLFWVGGFATILSPCLIAVMNKIRDWICMVTKNTDKTKLGNSKIMRCMKP